MDLLIDTHAVIWFITEDPKLPKKTRQLLADVNNKCFVSIASFWEIAIKNSLGRLDLNSDLINIFRIIEETGFELLPVTLNHILFNSKLNFYHQDPFDRMIIAQAFEEQLIIVTKDEKFAGYEVALIWDN